MKRRLKIFGISALCLSSMFAQDAVDVNLDVNHKVGEAGEFDRAKYIVIHDDLDGSEWDSNNQRQSFLEGYDVYFGRNNGGIVWEWNNTKEDPNKAGWPDISYMETRGSNSKSSYASNTTIQQFENRYENMMIGGQEHMYPHGQETREGLIYSGHEATAEFYANYIKNFFGTGGSTGKIRPKMLEVCNEPFVKASDLGVTKETLAEYHNDVALRVKELNPDIMVGGYSAAHPAFENNNNSFDLWEANWRMFIDVAGENMDFFSFHLYDFAQTSEEMQNEMYRSGSNIEGIMDMINHYSVLSLGETKPWSISEYGWLCKTCDGGYDIKEDWYNLRSFNNMMVQLLERPDQLINAIPFMVLKATWAKLEDTEYNTYGPRIMREVGEVDGEVKNGEWVYTELIKYYEFWKNVNGTRVDTKSVDIDVMADAYIEDKKMYLILSNLEKGEKSIDLNLIGNGGNSVESIMVKHLYAVDDIPVLDTTYYNNAIDEVTLGSQATMILEYEFANSVTIDQTTDEKTYWANKYKVSILPSRSNTFRFTDVDKSAHGEATLRLGLGRVLGAEMEPIIEVNGTALDRPRNMDWRGYDQGTRDSYFGVVEIDVPYELLVDGENEVMIEFSDNGGFITSVGLQVFNFSRAIPRFDEAASIEETEVYKAFGIFPNPANEVVQVRTDIEGQVAYTITNMSGQTIKKGSIMNRDINVSDLSEGMYFLALSSGSQYQNFKLIIN